MEISNELIRSLGMAMVHSLWQGAIISMVVILLLALIPKSHASIRYTVLFSALLLLLAVFAATFIILYRQSYSSVAWGKLTNTLVPSADQVTGTSWPLTPSAFAGWFYRYVEPACPALALGWLTGFLLLGIRSAGSVMVSRKNLQKGLEFPAASLQRIFDRLQDSLKMPVIARLRVSTRMISPLVTGFLKPVVVIPAAAISGLSTEQIEAVIVHELAHLRRFDHILVVLQALAGQILFFHPAVWFLLPEINRERENCCDDFVLINDNNPINYIKALTMIQEMNLHGTVPANALTGKPNHLLDRIRRLVKAERKHSPVFRLTVMLLFFATIGVSAMTLILAGKTGSPLNNRTASSEITANNDFQSDFTQKLVLDGTINTTTIDRQDGQKKKMKIVFAKDTIKEISVNGKPLTSEERKEYEDEVLKMRQEMESAQRELEKAQKEMQEAQLQMEIAREKMETIQERMHEPEFGDLDFHLKGDLSEVDINLEQFEKIMQSEEFREQMKRAQQDAKRAFDDMKIRQKENWRLHQDEFKVQMKKAQEEARRALEEMKKNKELFYNYNWNFMYDHPEFPFQWDHNPPFPPVPDVGVPVEPDIEEFMYELPDHSFELLPEEPAIPEDQPTEPLDSKLRELEKQ